MNGNNREVLVCVDCKAYIFPHSAANKAPRWTGKPGDPPEKRKEIGGQDDLLAFRRKHKKHEVIEAEPE